MSNYVCTNCKKQVAFNIERCPHCSEEGTIVKNNKDKQKKASKSTKALVGHTTHKRLQDVKPFSASDRMSLDTIPSANKVFSGGLPKSTIILIGGNPGVGKSTLGVQSALSLAQNNRVLYVSSEESEAAISEKAGRFMPSVGLSDYEGLDMHVQHSQVIEDVIEESVRSVNPDVLVIDSLNDIASMTIDSLAGNPKQIQYCISLLKAMAKQTGCVVIVISHVTKAGDIAGPQTLQHDVDGVFMLEGDATEYRFFRALKYRHGNASEVGVFKMTGHGLESIINPSAEFLRYREPAPGSSIVVSLDSSTSIALEVEALVSGSGANNANGSRTALSIDRGELQLVLDILNKYTRIDFTSRNVSANIVSGIKVSDTSFKLALAVSLMSSVYNENAQYVPVGIVKLTGMITPAPNTLRRLKELQALGFNDVIIAEKDSIKDKDIPEGMNVKRCEYIQDVIRLCFPVASSQ